MSVRETHRWHSMAAFALVAAGLGVVAHQPPLLLVAVVSVAFAAYGKTAARPTVDLSVERTVADDDPNPGDEVRVTVEVENAGDRTLWDLRLVDGVPPALGVSSGSPRLGTALRPGKRATFSYVVTARRGHHEFEPMTVVARDVTGVFERETEVAVETVVTCRPPLVATEPVPLRAQTTQYTGQVSTDVGGEGVEFYATREYRPTDSLSRIDWKRHARTGRLTTLEFREERAATVVMLIDSREGAYLARNGEHAVDLSVDAAGKVFDSLLESGDRVGVAAFGPGECWLDPGAGQDHRARARDLFATSPGLSPFPPSAPFHSTVRFRSLRKRLPDDAQIVLFSPLCDDVIATVARRFDAYGHAVTVISPDVTETGTAGERLAWVERNVRLNSLRESGVRVIDWDTDESLGAALQRARAGWSR